MKTSFCGDRVAGQRGFVLLTALVMLLVLTLIALVAMSFEANQARVAGNTANAQIAFETAEGALRVAEGNLLSSTYAANQFVVGGTNGLYLFNPVSAPIWSQASTWAGTNVIVSGFTGQSATAALVVIEQLPSVSLPGQNLASIQYGGGSPPARVYRITARAVGFNGKAPVMVQSIFHE